MLYPPIVLFMIFGNIVIIWYYITYIKITYYVKISTLNVIFRNIFFRILNTKTHLVRFLIKKEPDKRIHFRKERPYKRREYPIFPLVSLDKQRNFPLFMIFLKINKLV